MAFRVVNLELAPPARARLAKAADDAQTHRDLTLKDRTVTPVATLFIEHTREVAKSMRFSRR